MNEFDAQAWLASFGEGEVAEPSVPYGAPVRRPNKVVDETFELASRVMDYSEVLVKQNPVFADQILRSGTSVGSHVREAQGAQSLRAFINKMKVAHQELEETDYRLDLCQIKAHYPHDPELVRRTKALFPLFNAILSTSIARLKMERADRGRNS
jgi:four helix bundle protein